MCELNAYQVSWSVGKVNPGLRDPPEVPRATNNNNNNN